MGAVRAVRAIGQLPMLAHAHLARLARLRADATGCGRHIRAACAAAVAEGIAPRELNRMASIEPILRGRGLYFACIVTSAAGTRTFLKAVPSRGREAQLWSAWSDGRIRTEGEHYRLHPPIGIQSGALITLLHFPVLPDALTRPRGHRRRFRANLGAAVQVIAGFNADHAGAAALLLPRSDLAARLRVPTVRALKRAFDLPSDDARVMISRLRAAHAGWAAVLRATSAAEKCLCHLDFGPSNLVTAMAPPTLLDFGMTGSAPIGADLHTMMRFDGGSELPAMAEAYARVLENSGIAVSPEAIIHAAEVHFAARYTNLRQSTARHVAVFQRALTLAARLAEKSA